MKKIVGIAIIASLLSGCGNDFAIPRKMSDKDLCSYFGELQARSEKGDSYASNRFLTIRNEIRKRDGAHMMPISYEDCTFLKQASYDRVMKQPVYTGPTPIDQGLNTFSQVFQQQMMPRHNVTQCNKDLMGNITCISN